MEHRKPPGRLPSKGQKSSNPMIQGAHMGINSERDIEANLQIGPTDQGMVRLYVEAQGIEIPMDFTPDEAEEIAAEIVASAGIARGKSS
jgi:hypothetical protein